MASAEEFEGPTTELLQTLIRNECVNDGTPDSGFETRSSDTLVQYLEGSGVDVQTFTPHPGRDSMVARIEGSDPGAPSLCLMGHTDVVPVTPSGWERDPFGGELVDGEVWGRGAIDMLNLTSSMAVAFRRLADEGFTPKGDLIFFGVGDEEAGGVHGAEWMAEHHWDVIDADYVLTELGGWSTESADGVRHVTVNVNEKGLSWRRLRVRGTPGHGSMPFGADNALVKSAEIVRRLTEYRPSPLIDEIWRAQVATMNVPDDIRAGLLDPARIWDTIATLPTPVARTCHAHTHTTFSPNVVHGGAKTNIIPDVVDLHVDIRTVPGTTQDDVMGHLRDALGDLFGHVEVDVLQNSNPTSSPFGAGTPLWDAMERHTQTAYPNAQLVPGLVVGGTDARFYRERGRTAYGAGLYSRNVDFATFGSRFHGHNERIDVESLGLSANFWYHIARDLLT
ncbi:MAG: M20/M25/M40 family metallo-hydrolase [Ilumatobacter sp.]|jgi:acetylornithine deacetylase/succinyl-diaminopimelate desuccinylase-like protein|uniref:M20/M25/M40 family metallo-hydrolase n=1 Tax=Ilumatobacter sp. TaxID=1967498 RepID=UPI00391C9C04